MSFIWVDSASKIKSPYEVQTRSKHVKNIEKVPMNEAINDPLDTLTLSEEYQEAAGHLAYKQASEKRKSNARPQFAEEIMSSPVKTLDTETPLHDAMEFFKLERFRHVPIVNSEGALIGIISDRDMLKDYHDNREKYLTNSGNIVELIKSRILTASPDTKISEIARIMFEERIGAMPILDSSHKLIGIITRSDILRALIKQTPVEIKV